MTDTVYITATDAEIIKAFPDSTVAKLIKGGTK